MGVGLGARTIRMGPGAEARNGGKRRPWSNGTPRRGLRAPLFVPRFEVMTRPAAVRLMTLRWSLIFVVGAIAVLPAAAAAPATAELERYAGTYVLARGRSLSIKAEGDHLLAQPSNGPTGTLRPLTTPRRFELEEAPFSFEFLEDPTGKLTGLEMTTPNGVKMRLRRVADGRGTVESLQAVAVDADTSVNARLHNGYERVKGTDGKFRTETYAFGNGGFQRAAPVVDPSIEGMSFDEISRTLAPALAAQGYFAATDPEKTDLIIMVYWGTTTADDDPAVIAEESLDPSSHVFRNRLNRMNARLLGYEESLERQSAVPTAFTSSRLQDLLLDLGESRYWVALVAIDFRTAWKEKKVTPRWSITYNIRSQGTKFGPALAQMTQVASNHFGRDTKGLINRALPGNDGKVEVGTPEVIRFEPAK